MKSTWNKQDLIINFVYIRVVISDSLYINEQSEIGSNYMFLLPDVNEVTTLSTNVSRTFLICNFSDPPSIWRNWSSTTVSI